MEVYEPQEDTFLLARVAKRCARGKVLEVGAGSGYVSKEAASSRLVEEVVAADIDADAVEFCRKIRSRKLRCVQSDLFANISGKFDTILFNPPYLPQELRERDPRLEGGRRGFEVIERFLREAPRHLNADGEIFLLFSSLSHPAEIDRIRKQELLEWEVVEGEKVFFEELFVYRIWKSPRRKKLDSVFKDIRFFARGRRGFVFRAKKGSRSVAVKVERPDAPVSGTIDHEAKVLQLVNEEGLGPEYVMSGDGWLAYEFVEGEYFHKWLESASAEKRKRLLLQLLEQALKLDRMGISKEEMLRPLKNAIVSDGELVLIDFERAHKSERPNNVTQALQFISGFAKDKQKVRELAKEYSRTRNPAVKKKVAALL